MVTRQSNIARKIGGALVAAIMAAAWHGSATAQGSLTITFPGVIAAGPDYATDVLHDPWDMSNAEDVSPEVGDIQNFTTFNVSGGRAGGTTANIDASVAFLYRGQYSANNIGKNGFNFPIDTSRYQKLSVSLSDSGVGENPQVYWFTHPIGDPDAPSPGYGIKFLPPTHNGINILTTDLSVPTGNGSIPWTSAPMKGFRIDPNSDHSGQDVFFDWVRITCADNSPCATMNNISWSGGAGAGALTVDVLDSQSTVLNIANLAGNATSVNWNSGILPPGNYTLRVTRAGPGGSVATKTFRINAPPLITVTDPSKTTGEDYATTVLANAWDMSTSNDIVGSANVSPLTFSGGQLNGTNVNNDPIIYLLNNLNNGGGSKAIDSSRYRYLTYRVQIEGPYDLGAGSVARVFWGSSSSDNGPDLTTTRDIIVFDNMRSYTIDLATLTVGVNGGIEAAGTQELWTTNSKRQLRFDPHEFPTTRPFHIDDVKLTAIPETFGTYTIHWAGADSDVGDAATVSLYYDNDLIPTNGKTLIAAGLPIAQGSFNWDASAVPLGTYYIYAEATDGLNVNGSYSDSPILRVTQPCTFTLLPTSASSSYAGSSGTVAVTASAATCGWTAASQASFITVTGGAAGTGNGTVSYTVARNTGQAARNGTITIGGQTFTITQFGLPVTAGDFDGNGRADFAAFNPRTGVWSAPGQTSHQFGLPGDIPVPGDYNGDRILDRAVFRPGGGLWFIEGQTTIQWGLPGDIPVPADYDGDGITDQAVFRPSASGGVWFVRGQLVRAFGGVGDVPIPADYDGDGKADLAVYRPSTGVWSIALSTTGFATVTTIQWGLPGDVPVTGDFDGDHRADVVVYRPAAGSWFMLFSSANYTTSFGLNWGILGDAPLAADFTGDGVADAAVFRASDATWWIYDRVTGTASAGQQGSPGDVPAVQRPRRPVVATSDFDADGRSDITVFRPANGTWFTRLSYNDYQATQSIQWGLGGDVPVPGDYDGDHKTDTAVWRPANGTWYLKFSIGGFTNTRQVQWGLSTDVPVPADYDGDGWTDIAVYRPAENNWYVRFSSSDYAAVAVLHWGEAGDLPVPGDYDGDGRADVAIFRPSTGEWWLNRSSLGVAVQPWGVDTDVPMAGDVDGDGRADLMLFRPSTGEWLAKDPNTGAETLTRQWGLTGDTPVPHDYDGDGAIDTAVFRPSNAGWYIVRSSAPSAPFLFVQWGFGGSDDRPLLRANR